MNDGSGEGADPEAQVSSRIRRRGVGHLRAEPWDDFTS
jgi:hypothetical protein